MPSAQSSLDAEVMQVVRKSVLKHTGAPEADPKLRALHAAMPPVEKIEQMACLFRGRATSFPNSLDLPHKVSEVAW